MGEIDAFAAGREGDLAALLREMDGWTARVTGMLEELARERLEGADASGVVRARVSGTGRLLGLDIDARGLRDLDHERLAEAVKEAVGAARTAMGDRLAELTGDPASAADPLAPHVERVMREG
ncbi:YbaB/EbfC family nucleoid-associated protein [Nonomuraea harbinensis]|uniref:YbaB/EbfC family nucleoid-associated protein n=1 Tax=Nonomuraea harbinensis TaxID=1286938 RepID=A0ABW1BRU6_9ACTN|nr:YbaB/EbfC family nucleoid-associated protein [Nonomuraea harbinensis]